jgi:hypothetical protein
MTDCVLFVMKFAVLFVTFSLNSSLLVMMNYLVKRLEPTANASVLSFSASGDNVPTLSPEMKP